MKTIKQLLRQRVKSLFGILLMSLAAAILCICVGQAIAARTTIKELDNSFTTAGVPEGTIKYDGYENMAVDITPPVEFVSWVEETAQNYPDIVKKLAKHGVLSAYIPELTPLNYTEGGAYSTSYIAPKDYHYGFLPENPEGMPYTTAMLTFRLEEISEPQEILYTYKLGKNLQYEDFPTYEDYVAYQASRETLDVLHGYTVKLSGEVTGVVSLQEGYRDPTGMTLRLTLTIAALDELEAMELELGAEYIAFGMDYLDADWVLRSTLASDEDSPIEIEKFDLSRMKILEGKELEMWQLSSPPNRVPYAIYQGWKKLTREEYEMVNSVSMSMGYETHSTKAVIDDDGNFLGYEELEYRYAVSLGGETVTIPQQEYATKYQMPTIARLDTSVEEFLGSEHGKVWQETLEWSEVNHQAFLVLGVDDLDYVADFTRQRSRIVAGRDFTDEELATGARVCIVNEALATANDLYIGDTITLSLYQVDVHLPQFESQQYKTNLSAYFYVPTTPFTETAEYTVIGYWRGGDLWPHPSNNEYALTNSTVIVPKSSVQTEMGYVTSKAFTTLILHNGKGEEYRALASQMGYENAYIFDDQGYAIVAENFHNYDEMAERVVLVGVALYGVLLVLFLLLFPVSRRKTVQIMCSLGEPFGKRFWNVTAYAASLLLPAALLGIGIGAAAWQSVVNALVGFTDSSITMALNPVVLAVIALVQCVPALLLIMLVALPVARPFGMRKKG